MSSLLSSLRTPKALRATYTGLAPVYDALVPFVSSEARILGRNWLRVQDGEHVLDVGTGTGLAVHRLASANPTGWTEGVDRTPAMLRRARKRMSTVPHARFGLRQSDATALPYPNDSFHAVFSSYFLDVLPEPRIRSALHEMRRVLRPRGRLVLVYLTAPQRPIEHLWTVLANAVPPLAGGARPISLQQRLGDCGFTLDARTTCSQASLRSAITRAIPS